MVFTSPSRISRLVQNDIDRLGSHSKPNPTRKELTLPSILEVNEDPLSSPTSATRTPTSTDITTMSSLLQELMLTLVTASTTSTSTSSPNMTPAKVMRSSSSTSTSFPSRLSHFDLTEHDIDGLSHIAPSLATSPMRVPSRSVSVSISPSSLAVIKESNEEVMGASMEQTSALLRRLSLSLENVINSTPHEPLQSPLSCQQSQREIHTIMTSPHKMKIPISASSSASPNISPDVSPRNHRGPMMIM